MKEIDRIERSGMTLVNTQDYDVLLNMVCLYVCMCAYFLFVDKHIVFTA
jgi:hypothetical protein